VERNFIVRVQECDMETTVFAGFITILIDLDEVINCGHYLVSRVSLTGFFKLSNLEIARRLPKIFGRPQVGFVSRVDAAVGLTLAEIVASLIWDLESSCKVVC